jgi:hypothetical protein
MRKLINRFAELCEKRSFRLGLLVSACVVVIVLPIAIGGLHASGDLVVYLSFAEEFRTAMLSGDILPGWANDNRGFGSVGIRFYPPVAPYALALIRFLTINLYDAIWIYFFGWLIVGCLGVYLFVKDWGTRVQAVLAGMLYAVIPFPLAEIYQFSLFAEFAAGALIPYSLLFVTRICRRREWIDALFLGILFSLLILTHIPTTIITTICLFIYVMFIVEWKHFRKTILQLGAAASVALVTSAFYWIKVITEVSWLAHNRDEFSTGFAGFELWVFPNWFPGRDDVPYYYLPIYRNIDAMIVLTVLMLIPFSVLWFSRRDKTKIVGWTVMSALTVTSLFAFFMTTRASVFVWSAFPLLQKIQFPWRWLTVISVLSTASLVLSVSRLSRELPSSRAFIAFFLAGLIGLMIAFDVRQSFARSNRVSRGELAEITSVANIATGASATAWWPVWASAKAFEVSDQVIAGGRRVEISKWESKDRRFKIDDGPQAQARVATFYYPHWKATVNGEKVDVGKDENGAITIPVGTETADITLSFDEPGLNRAALWVSLISWILAGLVSLWAVWQRVGLQSRTLRV